MRELSRVISYILGILLLLAVLPLPYGCYTFLRLVIFIGGLFLAYQIHKQKQFGWAIGLVGIAILFNPLIPVYLTREIWLPIDLVSAGLFFYSSSLMKDMKV